MPRRILDHKRIIRALCGTLASIDCPELAMAQSGKPARNLADAIAADRAEARRPHRRRWLVM